MNLVTRCPQCATTFRVSQAQLSARGGRVRCGKCSAAFDGVAHLVEEEAPAQSPEALPPQTGEVQASAPDQAEMKGTAALEHFETHSPAASEGAPPVPPDTALNAHAGDLVVEPETTPPKTKIVVPAFLAPQRARPAFTLMWALLTGMALAALALQAALHFRTELAVLLPSTRLYLESACDMLGCEVKLPRRADLMSIESSDLQADNQRPGVIVLNALLRNRAPFAQEYPDLELTLTDQGDRPVIRRVLEASDYLQEKRQARGAGLAGGAEETVRVYLDTGGIPATGYQLFLFYACPPPATSTFWQLSYPPRCQDSRNK